MKLLFAALGALLLTGMALQTVSASSTSPNTDVHVNINNYAFQAPSITIAPGTTVVFKNLDDDPHTVTAVDGSFDSKGLGQGDTWSHRFTTPGTYAYYCKVHPMMKGTVVVTESGS